MGGIPEQFQTLLATDTTAAYEFAIQVALEKPTALLSLCHACFEDRQQLGYLFSDLLSHLPLDDYPELIERALVTLAADPDHRSAENVIHCATLQALPHIHARLDDLYAIESQRHYVNVRAWRESGLGHVEMLKRVYLDLRQPDWERKIALTCLAETREPEALQFVASMNDGATYLHHVGHEERETGIHALYPDQPLHIIFPLAYRLLIEHPIWTRPTHHPTWRLPLEGATAHRFGGEQAGECRLCGGGLHHLITLDPIPPRLAIYGLSRLTLATCLSCIGTHEHAYTLYYQHDAEGQPCHTGYAGDFIDPGYLAEPLLETPVFLAEAGSRWRWQDVIGATGAENWHRVGGHPVWIQNPRYPDCPHCGGTMRFLLQIGSYVLSADGVEWLWGDSGIAYVHWCDACMVSAVRYDCF